MSLGKNMRLKQNVNFVTLCWFTPTALEQCVDLTLKHFNASNLVTLIVYEKNCLTLNIVNATSTANHLRYIIKWHDIVFGATMWNRKACPYRTGGGCKGTGHDWSQVTPMTTVCKRPSAPIDLFKLLNPLTSNRLLCKISVIFQNATILSISASKTIMGCLTGL